MQQQTQKQDIIIKKVLNNGANSRERLHQLQKEQQYLSETFKIDKFYNNQKLDISTLKNKINQIKRKADEQQQQSIKEVRNQVRNQVQNQVKNQVRNQVHNKKVQFKQNPQQLKQILIPLNNRIQRLFLYKKQRIKINSGVVNREIQIRSSRNMRNSSAFDKKPNINLIATQNTITISNRDRIDNNYKTKNKSSLQTSQQLQHYAIKPSGRYKSNDKNRTISNLSRNSNKNYYQQVQQQSNSQQQILKLRQSQIPKIQSIGRRRNFQTNQKQKQPQKQKQRQGNLTRLEPISCFKRKLTFIKIQSAQQLKQFQTNINSLWNVYQKLSKIVQILSYQSKSVLDQSLISQQFISILLQYKTEVCSTKLQFLIKIIDTCLQYSHAKIVILSRLLQNLSVVYIFLQILQQTLYNANNKNKANQFNSSHLVNFVGICSNNILLIIRLITLVSVISSRISLSENTSNIFRAILQFQITSYRAELNSIKDTIIRIEHNNQLTTIIQSKINNKMYTRQYHKGFFGKLVKGVLIDRLKQQIQVVEDKFNVSAPQTKPFFQYSYLFFQYLAFHIHQQQCLGLFPKQIQTAPEPYLPLTKQFTIIIDPTRVLVHQGKSKIFVRAYAQEFLQALSQKCNIIFWNQRMPNQIDSLCDLVDVRLDQSKLNPIQIASSNLNSSVKDQIKRLYKHHCFYDYNSKGQLSLVKDVSRVGSSSGKYIIFDTKFDSYYARQEARTILLPWKGEQKDLKLAVVLQILLPFFRQGANLDKSLKLLKPQLYQLLRVKKNRDINKAI